MSDRIFGTFITGVLIQQVPPLYFLTGIITLLALCLISYYLPHFSLIRSRVVRYAICIILFLSGIFTIHVDHDEAEHMHCAWLMSQGELPFRDFWEHHSPLPWIVLAPLVKQLPPGPAIFDTARVISGVLALLTLGVLLWWQRRLKHPQAAQYWLVVAWLGAFISTEIFVLRPDLVGNILAFGAIGVLVFGRGALADVVSGFLTGFMLAFSPKHSAFFILPAILMMIPFRVSSLSRLVWFALGAILGLAPLVLWLQTHGLTDDFYRWVYKFNAEEKGLTIGGAFPLTCLIIFIGYMGYLYRKGKQDITTVDYALVLMWLFGAATYFFAPGGTSKFFYNLQMCYLVSALMAGPAIHEIKSWMSLRWRPVFVSAFTLLMIGTVVIGPFIDYHRTGGYQGSRKEVVLLQKLAGGEPVLGRGCYHPQIVNDAVNLNLYWHWLWFHKPELKAYAGNLEQELRRLKPPLIWSEGGRENLPDFMRFYCGYNYQQAQAFLDFLDANYQLVKTNHSVFFWVRNDRLPILNGIKQ